MIRFAKKIAKFPEPVQRAVLRQLADERRGQVPLPLRPRHRAQRRGAVALRRQLPGPRDPVILSAMNTCVAVAVRPRYRDHTAPPK